MSALSFLIPIALFMGIAGLGAFLWSLRTGHHHLATETAQRIDSLGLVLGEGGGFYRVDSDFPCH
ncbi:cbb3-type cytochrome oxidase assembly protein CcoS [Rhizobium ruizarguesonis]